MSGGWYARKLFQYSTFLIQSSAPCSLFAHDQHLHLDQSIRCSCVYPPENKIFFKWWIRNWTYCYHKIPENMDYTKLEAIFLIYDLRTLIASLYKNLFNVASTIGIFFHLLKVITTKNVYFCQSTPSFARKYSLHFFHEVTLNKTRWIPPLQTFSLLEFISLSRLQEIFI